MQRWWQPFVHNTVDLVAVLTAVPTQEEHDISHQLVAHPLPLQGLERRERPLVERVVDEHLHDGEEGLLVRPHDGQGLLTAPPEHAVHAAHAHPVHDVAGQPEGNLGGRTID